MLYHHLFYFTKTDAITVQMKISLNDLSNIYVIE